VPPNFITIRGIGCFIRVWLLGLVSGFGGMLPLEAVVADPSSFGEESSIPGVVR
jgi:hypothetical protein